MENIRISNSGIVVLFLLCSCGGAKQSSQTGDIDSCNAKASSILEQDTICDPVKIATVEKEITEWQQNCEKDSQELTKNLMAQRLADSQKCSDDFQRFDKDKSACRKRVDEVLLKKDCALEECETLIVETNKIIDDCSGLGEGETGISDAKAFIQSTSLRIEKEKFNKEVQTLAEKCKEMSALTKEKKTDDALTLVVLALASPSIQNELKDIASSESTTKEVFAACGEGLKVTIDVHVKKISEVLKKKEGKVEPQEWMANFRNLEGTNTRLQEVGVEIISPEATQEMQELLLSYDKQRNINESKAMDKAASETKRALKGGAEKCKRLLKQIDRAKKKIEEHTKASNENKVRAYTKKLEKADNAYKKFIKLIKKSVSSGSLTEKEKTKISKELEKAGCSL